MYMRRLSIYVNQNKNTFFKEIREYDDSWLEYEYYENEEIEVRDGIMPLAYRSVSFENLLRQLSIWQTPYNQQPINGISYRAKNMSNATPMKYKAEYIRDRKMSDLV